MSSMEETNRIQVLAYTSSIRNIRGQRLFCKYWEPAQKARALVFVAHGFAEHSLIYESLAQALASKDFLVFSHDHVGHGQSEGARAQIDSFDKFVDDVFKHTDIIRERFPDLECFICGHSMGGAISILAALKRPEYFKGVVLIAPAVMTNPEVATPFRVTISKILRWITPYFPVAPLDLNLISSCPKQVERMRQDPLRYHGYCKASLAASLLDACEKIQKNVKEITVPFIVYQGEEDKLCIPAGAVFVHEHSISDDKSIRFFKNAYHSLLYEPNGIAEILILDIVQWISGRS